uniref:Fibronectin type-III domain-containing protein n=1 Tax=Hucho hucho TaxID=62062 RepID=A0A4W5RIS9_9TELE
MGCLVQIRRPADKTCFIPFSLSSPLSSLLSPLSPLSSPLSTLPSPLSRFVSLYRGPCHTHKVQRLNESTSYMFRIQAFNEAGQGPFSTVYTFTTPRSPPAPIKAPRVERVEDLSSVCEVSWEPLLPMKGDPIIYTVQSMMGNSEYKQVRRMRRAVIYVALDGETHHSRYQCVAPHRSHTTG